MSVDSISVYLTASNAIRKTADDCRRITALFDALRVKHEKILIDTKEMMAMISELSGSKALPQTFVGDQFLGSYETIFKMNEQQQLAVELRRLGYAGDVVGGEHIPIAQAEPQKVTKRVVVKKKVVKKKPNGDDDDDAPPPPPEDDDDEGAAGEGEGDELPPPPPDDDEGGGDPPPPPDEEEDPPPPPDD